MRTSSNWYCRMLSSCITSINAQYRSSGRHFWVTNDERNIDKRSCEKCLLLCVVLNLYYYTVNGTTGGWSSNQVVPSSYTAKKPRFLIKPLVFKRSNPIYRFSKPPVEQPQRRGGRGIYLSLDSLRPEYTCLWTHWGLSNELPLTSIASSSLVFMRTPPLLLPPTSTFNCLKI